MLREGMQVMLLGLQSSPELNFKVGELGPYLRDSQRWVVELPCGRKVKVRQANMQTIDASVKNFYRMFGYPDKNTPLLADLVEIRTGEHGRRLFAKQAISKSTFARDEKLCVSMTKKASKYLGQQWDALCGTAMRELMSTDIEVPMSQRSHNAAASYVGKCVKQGWLQNAFILDLLNHDWYSEKILQETMERMHVEDFFWHLFWVSEVEPGSEDALWRLQSLLMSHAFLRDRDLTVGISSYAACTDERWKWLLAMRSGKKPEPLPSTPEVTGNFMEMPAWLMQEQQVRTRSMALRVDDCIIFHEDISAGEELLLDYEENYFLEEHKQLRHACPPQAIPYILNILKPLDPRVTEAFEAHMRK
jgi:hypothetical protein